MTDERRLAARFAELSGTLLSSTDEETTFQSVVERAVEIVPDCDHAGWRASGACPSEGRK